MNNSNQRECKTIKLARTILGGLVVGLSATSVPALAQPGPMQNPCPGIYYEEPFASAYAVPEGCPPNAATQRLEATGQLATPNQIVVNQQPGDTVAGERMPSATPGRIVVNQQPSDTVAGERMPSATPGRIVVNQQPSDTVAGETNPQVVTPEDTVIATVTPTEGTIAVRLINNTNTLITYEATGQTARRYLQGGEEITLEGLPTPTTVRMTRQDGGFVQATPIESTEPGLLVLSLNETAIHGRDDSAITVQEDGSVLSY
ncbi:MAG: hypothetical protein Kow00121_33450 [Elainellaceae cyanobacterium]